GQLGGPRPGGDPGLPGRCAPDQVRDQALNTGWQRSSRPGRLPTVGVGEGAARTFAKAAGGRMYGLVNKAIEDLVISLTNEDTWLEIARRADIDVVTFVSLDTYDDAL